MDAKFRGSWSHERFREFDPFSLIQQSAMPRHSGGVCSQADSLYSN
jgi:hypothetical protein